MGKSVTVLTEFRDIDNFDKIYKEGEKVDTFSTERIKGLVSLNLVDDGSAAEAEAAAKKAADDAKKAEDAAKKAAADAKKAEDAAAKKAADDAKKAEDEAKKKADDEAKKAKADADNQPQQ